MHIDHILFVLALMGLTLFLMTGAAVCFTERAGVRPYRIAKRRTLAVQGACLAILSIVSLLASLKVIEVLV